MAVPAGVKFDDGSGHFVSNCFPVRNIFGASENAGAWLVAHRAEQIKQLTVVKAEPKTYAQLKYERKQKEKQERLANEGSLQEEEDSVTPGTLDGFFLLKHCCVEDPTDVCSVNIAGQNLAEVKEEDFELFVNVAYINAGENLLPFEKFNYFPIVRELELPLNGLRGIQLDYHHFPHLEVLDLSHNNLSKDDVLSLGLLTNLKVLYLTGNQLRSLPVEMSKPYKVKISEVESSQVSRFSTLEILHLDDNLLHDLATFASLAGLRKLKQLNLDKNDIVSVPHLKATSGKLVAVDSAITDSPSSTPGRRDKSSKTKKRNKLKTEDLESSGEMLTPHRTEQDKASISDATSQLLADIEEEGDLTDVAAMLGGTDGAEQLPPPFPELEFLSLAHNKIAEEEGLLAVAAWPMLQELVIHDNPLTTQHSGDPPLLKRYLRDRLGIRMVRKKPSMVPKPPVKVPNKPHRKVAEIVPPIPKKPLQLMLEGPPSETKPALPSSNTPPPKRPQHPSKEESTRPSSQPLPPIQPTPPIQPSPSQRPRTVPSVDGDVVDEERFERTKSWAEESFGGSDVNEETKPEKKPADKSNDEPVFLTQVDELGEEEVKPPQPQPPQTPKAADKPQTRKKRVDSAAYSMNIPQKFKGYEIFYDAEDDPEVYAAPDIQSNLRALRLTLKHSTTYGENKVNLEKLQKPFEPYQKTKVPGKPPYKSKAEKLEDALDSMKTRETYIEANLAEILSDKEQMKEFPNVKKLLEEIQNKYSAVRHASMKDKQEQQDALTDIMGELEAINRKLKTAGSYHSKRVASRQPLSK